MTFSLQEKTEEIYKDFPIFFSLKRYFWHFCLAALLGGGIGIATTFAVPKHWDASILFQVAQVGNSTTSVIEPANVVQRIQFPSFKIEVLSALGLPSNAEVDSRSQLIQRTLQARIERSGNLIELSVRGFTPDEAKKSVETALKVIQNEHEKLLLPSEARLKDNLTAVTSALSRINGERATLLAALEIGKNTERIEKKFSESILLANMIRASETEARTLRDQKLILEEQLSPYRTFNTKAIASTFVPNRPAFPKNIFFLIGGIVSGLTLMLCWILVRDTEFRSILVRKINNSGT